MNFSAGFFKEKKYGQWSVIYLIRNFFDPFAWTIAHSFERFWVIFAPFQ
jgi:hypothetical protein